MGDARILKLSEVVVQKIPRGNGPRGKVGHGNKAFVLEPLCRGLRMGEIGTG